MKNKKSRKWIILAVLIGICIVIACLSSGNSDTEFSESDGIHPCQQTIEMKKNISGNLYPIKEVDVKSSIAGALECYYVKIGDRVKTGDVIAKVLVLPVAAQLDNARCAVNEAAIKMANARDNYMRDSLLFKNNIISQHDLETVRAEFLLSEEAYNSAKNQLALLEGKSFKNKDLLNVVTATSDGVVADLPLKEGQFIVERSNYSEGTSIAQIAQTDYFIFKGKIVEEDVAMLRQGMEIQIIPSVADSVRISAKVEKISTHGKIEQGIMKYDIEAVFKTPENLTIFSGFSAIAEIIIDKKENVLSIPEKCLVFSNDSVYVKCWEDGCWKKSIVKTGVSNGIYIEITDGISENDCIKIK